MFYSEINKPFTIGNLELKNRIIFAPTTFGLMKKEYFKKIEAIAKGGCSMIIIGDVPVGRSRFGYSLYSKSGFSYYQELTTLIHKYNCKACAQLHQNDTNFKAMFKYVPQLLSGKIKKEDVRALLNSETGKYISNLKKSEIKAITSSFGPTAVQALQAGFDMIQVHGDRMCGSFSSSLFNKREDEYGGTIENRARFALESIRSIREVLPNIPIDYKLVIRTENPNYGKAGILDSEIKDFVPLLEKEGVSSFHVTLANHGNLEDTIPPINHTDFFSEGCFLPFCDIVRKYTTLPITAVGGFSHPLFIERELKRNRMDMVAMSRQLIADPQWVNKEQNGEEDNINYCKRCNKECLGGMYKHKGVHCIYDL